MNSSLTTMAFALDVLKKVNESKAILLIKKIFTFERSHEGLHGCKNLVSDNNYFQPISSVFLLKLCNNDP